MLFVILKFLWSCLCFDRSENKRPELFISHRSLHETESGAAMSRRTRRWILRVLLCLGIVYLKIGWAAFIWLLTLKVIIWHDLKKHNLRISMTLLSVVGPSKATFVSGMRLQAGSWFFQTTDKTFREERKLISDSCQLRPYHLMVFRSLRPSFKY